MIFYILKNKLFRTQGGDFGFPYHVSGRALDKARKLSIEYFKEGKKRIQHSDIKRCALQGGSRGSSRGSRCNSNPGIAMPPDRSYNKGRQDQKGHKYKEGAVSFPV